MTKSSVDDGPIESRIRSRRSTDASVTGCPALVTSDWLKRGFDIVAASLGLIVASPLFALIAILIKLETPGPVFFRQDRVGRGGRRFRMWKFRKMPHDLKTAGPSLTRRHDRRLTAVGKFLERTKLDELPQLINVLLGEMSLVGPRPEVPKFVAYYPERWQTVLAVRPGIFGPNQLHFRNEAELFPSSCCDVEQFYVEHILPKKLTVDENYARRHSFIGDLWILFRCALAVFGGTLTWRTLVVRRWQVLNFLVLSLAGLTTMSLAIQVSVRPTRYANSEVLLLLAALVRPLCLIAFRIPKALATSMTADDFLRLWWCGVTGSAGIAVGMIFLDHRDMSRQVLLLDAGTYLSFLLMYKLVLYKCYLLFVKRHERKLSRRMILASFVVAPASTLGVVLLRQALSHGSVADWWSRLVLPLTGMVTWPLIHLLDPILPHRSSIKFLVKEGRKVLFGSVVGMVIAAFSAILLNERAWSRADLIAASLTYGSTMLVIGGWLNRRASSHMSESDRERKADATTAGRQRLLIVGSGMHLSAYLTALAEAPDHLVEVVGIISPEPSQLTSMVGGYTVIGHLADIPEFLEEGSVTRLVVLERSLARKHVEEIENYCQNHPNILVRVDHRFDSEPVGV